MQLDRDSMADGASASSEEIMEVLAGLREKLRESERVLNFDDDHLLDNEDYRRLTGKETLSHTYNYNDV